jgi:hypothetical protein
MPSSTRVLATLLASVALILSALPVLATGAALPMPVQTTDWRRVDVTIRASRLQRRRGELAIQARDISIDHLIGDIGVLNNYYSQANQHAQTMSAFRFGYL